MFLSPLIFVSLMKSYIHDPCMMFGCDQTWCCAVHLVQMLEPAHFLLISFFAAAQLRGTERFERCTDQTGSKQLLISTESAAKLSLRN